MAQKHCQTVREEDSPLRATRFRTCADTSSIEAENVASLNSKKQPATTGAVPTSKLPPTIPFQTSVSVAVSSPSEELLSKANNDLYTWITKSYLDTAFSSIGFVGWTKFQARLINERPKQREAIVAAIKRQVDRASKSFQQSLTMD
jgi:hypothetical protein